MTEESNLEPMEEEVEVYDTDQAMDVVQDTLDTFLEAASVEAVYGEPIQNGETLIIPAAEVLAGLGFGVGSGFGSGSSQEGEDVGQGGGAGGGGGGRVLSRPVAVIIASPEGVRVEPVLDATKVALGFLTALGFMAAMVMRMSNPRRAMKELRGE